MVNALVRNNKIERKGPVVLVIMDGVGYGKYEEGDAVKYALTKNLDSLLATCPNTRLKAHGLAVGLPSDSDMGNSEVGHNAMGAGRVFAQGAKLVSQSIDSGAMFEGETWKKLVANVKKNNSTLHFIGLLSDGNVHSHIDHLKKMIAEAKKEGVKKVRVHALLDGRDVGEMSALEYFDPFTEYLEELSKDGTLKCQHLSISILLQSILKNFPRMVRLMRRLHLVADVWLSRWTAITQTGIWSKKAGIHMFLEKEGCLPPLMRRSRLSEKRQEQ